MPPLFLSHGAPDLVLGEAPAARFQRGLAALMPRPWAIVVASAHWTTRRPAVSLAAQPATIHDFGGFPAELSRMRYPAAGEPVLARRIAGLLAAGGLDCDVVERGLDHGMWTPLAMAWPAADIPVVGLAVQPGADAAHHLRLGRALAPLAREGVLIIGSGSATHDLGSIAVGDHAPDWVTAFDDWLVAAVERGDEAALLAWTGAPHARANHPTPEHFLPLLVAAGAAGPGWRGRALHRSVTYGVLAMTSLAFDPA